VGANPAISKLNVANNTITLQGQNLDQVSSLRLKDNNGHTYTLVISSQGSNQISASVTSALTLALGSIYSLIISSANAADLSVPISIQIPDNSIPSSALTASGAVAGQVLKYDGTKWVPGNDNSSSDSASSSHSGRYVVKDANGNILAYLLQFGEVAYNSGPNLALVNLPTGEIVGIDKVWGKYFRFCRYRLFYRHRLYRGYLYS